MKNRIRLTHHEGVSPFCFVILYRFPEVLTAKAVVILRADWYGIHRQPEYKPSLRPNRMRLSGGVDNQLFHGNVGIEPLVS